ncbi:unnamed protein product [Rotaria sordida]|uniref:Uncharacterized protein n=1 Tax=Rotaria sordida TaxID=392033 RepID=A0A814NGA8_9BILA|nr:unnamed protein product [Rotaria sordida]CAF1093200.1 unnamed protein product [Rotaria sordida]
MLTSCNTHDYDGKLRQKWFEMRPILIEKYLPNCLSFDDTIKDIEQWLDKKYYNIKRIGRARRSLRILISNRHSNFDSRNDIDVEELLPILWDKVKNQEDIHDTFYEQLCDITGGSCSQGRSTRLFQFLFLFDLPLEISKIEEEKIETSTEQQSKEKNLPEAISSTTSIVKEGKTEISTEQELRDKDLSSETSSITPKTEEEKIEISTEQESIKKDLLSETTFNENSVSISEENQQLQEKSKSNEEQLYTEEKPKEEQQLDEDQQSQRNQ